MTDNGDPRGSNQVTRVPLSPEMQRAMEAAQKLETAMDAELKRLLTPEGYRRLAESETAFERWLLFGDSPDA